MMTSPLGSPPAGAAAQCAVPWAGRRAVLPAIGLALSIGAMLFPMRAALAEVAPQLLPLRDVKIQYTVTAPGQAPHDYDLAFSAESERLRIDDPARGLWFLVDLRDASAAMVVPGLHVVVTEPDLANLAVLLASARNAQFTPSGEATIAGLHCTRYRVVSREATGTTCLTPDGIALAVSGEDARGSAQAVADAVSEAPVPAASLEAPPGFSHLALPPGTIAALLGK